MRRNRLRPPDLTSLFDVLFILVFVSLVNAGVNKQAADAAAVKKVEPPAPPPPPATDMQLHAGALEQIGARPTVIVRVTRDGVIRVVEAPGATAPMDVPLIEHVDDPDVNLAYLGDRSAELRVCRQAALHLGVADLSPYLVIVAPDAPLADLTVALATGLRRDAERCLAEQHAVAVVVGP